MLQENPILRAIKARDAAYGTWAQMNCAEFCELAARAGLDFVIVDMEHGSFGIDSAVNMIRAAEAGGAAAIVRVPDPGRSTILKVLDAGASGVLVPNIGSRAEAEAVVQAARYAPAGSRGACPCTRGTGHGVYDWGDYLEWSRRNILVSVIIETPDGVRNFDEIIATPGLDVVALGQFDLSQALGYEGKHDHPDVRRKIEDLARKARSKNVEVMTAIFDSNAEEIARQTRRWKEIGVRIMAVSGDRFMLASNYKAIAAAVSR